MKKLIFLLLIATALGFYGTDATAESQRLHYKMAPGQTWVVVMSTQNEFTVMGNKDVHRNKIMFDYTVSDGPKPGWVSLTGKITSMSGGEGGAQMDTSRMSFFAEMHSSGEIRNVGYEGSIVPAMGADAGHFITTAHRRSRGVSLEANPIDRGQEAGIGHRVPLLDGLPGVGISQTFTYRGKPNGRGDEDNLGALQPE